MSRNRSLRRGGQGARGNSTQQTLVTRTQLNSIKRQLYGAVLKGSPDPSTTVDRPWNSVVLSFQITTPGNVIQSAISSAFNTQVGSGSTTPVIEFRYRDVRVWETSGANVGLTLYDLVNADVDPYRSAHDEPGRNHWAHAGAMWSVADTAAVFAGGTSPTPIFAISSSATAVTITAHVSIYWRFAGTTAPTRIAEISC